MKKLTMVLAMGIVFGCGQTPPIELTLPEFLYSEKEYCSVKEVSNGFFISCPDGTNSLVLNGKDSVNDYSIVEFIDPCGDDPGNFDEVILKTAGGELVAYFENSGNRFLAVLEPGNYITTDNQSCPFEVSSEMEVTW